MKAAYHRAITAAALSHLLPPATLEIITLANLGQDALRYQFGHDHFHYDNNAFKAANAYAEECRQQAQQHFAQRRPQAGWQAFGRLSHTVQDFYAHSSYVSQWRQENPQATPEQIVPCPSARQSSALRSGRLYYPLELFSFIPGLRRLVLPLLPRDSHAWMNQDDPGQPHFAFAFAAAVKHTLLEYQTLIHTLEAYGYQNPSEPSR